MAKVSLGYFNVFNHETQEWSLYKDRLELWFLANDLGDIEDVLGMKRRAILLSSLAEPTYRLIRDLALPEDVGSLKYLDVVKLLDGHFKLKKCGFAERFKFHTAVQKDESLAEWEARVRGLAMHCGFPAGTLNEMLRDRFILGMAGGPERDRLFSEDLDGLTLEKALHLAESVRCAREGARQGSSITGKFATVPELDVHKMEARPPFQRRIYESTNKQPDQCATCGYYGHISKMCRFKFLTCRKCGLKGHLQRVCKSSEVPRNVQFLECCAENDNGNDDGKRVVFNIRTRDGEPMQDAILVDEIKLTFEFDSGSAVTVISDIDYNKHFIKHPLQPCTQGLLGYTGFGIQTLGMMTVPFTYKGETRSIDVYVVRNGGRPLLGRDFMSKFNLQISQVKSCEVSFDLEKIMKQYPLLFSDKLGCCKGLEVKLRLRPGSSPIYFKARPVPFALRTKIEQELNRLESEGIIEAVTFSEYASPIVPVLKSNGSIRLCADYSVTLNKQLIVEKYPLPRVDELFSKLHSGKYFTKLDLSSAYNQLILDKESQALTCINTHKGLYKYTRLVFGLSNAPAIFQRTMENILSGIDGVLQFLDDILLVSESPKLHLAKIHEVFRRLENAGLVLSKEKCSFFQNSVSYLGYVIDKDGLHKSPEKVRAVLDAKMPKNVTELKSFLGMVNYYRSFIKNASSILSPLHALLKKDVKWQWDASHDTAFESIKRDLASENTLAHFDPEAKIILTVDASPHGLGAILSQIDTDTIERPISYASRSLTSAEKQYSQIQKEATAIIFGVRKFHNYLYGRDVPFILRTDHKPLISIFRPDKGVPEVSANRLQRYALFLSAYNYSIEFVSSAHNSADFLSRSVSVQTIDAHFKCGKHSEIGHKRSNQASEKVAGVEVLRSSDSAAYINFIWGADTPPATLSQVKIETNNDSTLSEVVKFISAGWPVKITDKSLKPFFNLRFELAVENGCIMRGTRLVVPELLRKKIINELHKGHLGLAKMKAEARTRFWWPGIIADLEHTVTTCDVCTQLRPNPPRAPLTSWPYPSEPWYRVHLDLLGPFCNKVYLIAVDAYSKWVEVFDVSSGYGSRVIIEKLCEIMSRFGLINTICTDNGAYFISTEFEKFCSDNGISHLTSPTYHPASNGQAESYVKIIKRALKSILLSGTQKKDISIKLYEFLFQYRNSKHSSTNRTPAEILFGKKLRCRLDLLKTSSLSDAALSLTVKQQQSLQAKYFRGRRNVDFAVGDTVCVRIYRQHIAVWGKGVITERLGNSTYLVKLSDCDRVVKRHKNQMYEFKNSASSQLEGTHEAVVHQEDQVEESELNCPQFVFVEPILNPEVNEDVDRVSEETSTQENPRPIGLATETDTENWADCENTIDGPVQAPVALVPPPSTSSGDSSSRVLRPRKNIDYRGFY